MYCATLVSNVAEIKPRIYLHMNRLAPLGKVTIYAGCALSKMGLVESLSKMRKRYVILSHLR